MCRSEKCGAERFFSVDCSTDGYLTPHKFVGPVGFISLLVPAGGLAMFHQLFTSSKSVDRHSKSPLLEERLRYLTHCAEQGSTRSTLRLIAQHLLIFANQFNLEVRNNLSLEEIKKAADAWVGSSPRAYGMIHGRCGRTRFVSEARKWLRFLGRLQSSTTPVPYAHLINDFCDHLVHDRGLAQSTVRLHRWHITQFLERFWEQERSFDSICIRDIDLAIARKGEQDSNSRVSIAHHVGVLRVFFRYAEQRGWCSRGLAAAIMCPRVFADEGLPKGPSWQDVQRLLAATEGDHPKSIRDRAIVMLLRSTACGSVMFGHFGLKTSIGRGNKSASDAQSHGAGSSIHSRVPWAMPFCVTSRKYGRVRDVASCF
jgi:integrase